RIGSSGANASGSSSLRSSSSRWRRSYGTDSPAGLSSEMEGSSSSKLSNGSEAMHNLPSAYNRQGKDNQASKRRLGCDGEATSRRADLNPSTLNVPRGPT